MDDEARARANVPRPGARQTLTGLDPYHRLLRQNYAKGERQYRATKGSFSAPRPLPAALLADQSPDLSSSPSVDLNTFPEPPRSSRIENAPLESDWIGSSRGPSRLNQLSPPADVTSPTEGQWFGSSRNHSQLDYTSPPPRPTTPKSKPLPKTPSRSILSRFSRESSNSTVLPWRPFYLRRLVLLSFMGLFTLLIVALEIILDISKRKNGLGSSETAVRYIWQYGTTLVFVLLATLWARVEHQARVFAPWFCLSGRPAHADKTLMLDYVSMWQPMALIKALKNRDLLVASTGAVGIILKVLILFATTLATPTTKKAPISLSLPSNAVGARLVVRAVPTHLMVGFLAICIVLAAAAILVAPGHGFLPRDPGTLIGMATLLAHSDPLIKTLGGLGDASNEQIKERLSNSGYSTGVEGYDAALGTSMGYFRVFGGEAPAEVKYRKHLEVERWWKPVILRGIIKLLILMILATTILGLEICFRVSQQNKGLATVDEKSYIYLLWTILPALLMLCLVAYFDFADFWTKTLAPFRHLTRQGSFADSMSLNMVDSWKPAALRRACLIGDWNTTLTVLGVTVASLLTVASAALFKTASVRHTSDSLLKGTDFFGNSLDSSSNDPICISCTNDTTVASSILNSNASYPPFTFEGLNMPTLIVAGETAIENDIRIALDLTAIRPNLTCQFYPANEILTNLTVRYTMDNEIVNPLRVDVQGEPCRGDTERRASNAVIGTTGTDINGDAYFGVGLGRTNETAQCADWLYVWGQLANANSNSTSVRHINAMACNETIEAVDVEAVFNGPDLLIDPSDPPAPDESTAEDTKVAIPPLNYSLLAHDRSGDLLDPFFELLGANTSSVSKTLLGNSSTSAGEKMETAIKRQHGIIRAQSLNFKARRHLSSSGTFPTTDRGVKIKSGINVDTSASQAVPTYVGSAIDDTIRLRQDGIATRILQVILAVVLLLHILSWIMSPKTLLPRSPTNIASVAAFLVDGNIFQYLPPAAEWQPLSELERVFRYDDMAIYFRLGWKSMIPQDRKQDGHEARVQTYGIRVLTPGRQDSGKEMEMTEMRAGRAD